MTLSVSPNYLRTATLGRRERSSGPSHTKAKTFPRSSWRSHLHTSVDRQLQRNQSSNTSAKYLDDSVTGHGHPDSRWIFAANSEPFASGTNVIHGKAFSSHPKSLNIVVGGNHMPWYIRMIKPRP